MSCGVPRAIGMAEVPTPGAISWAPGRPGLFLQHLMFFGFPSSSQYTLSFFSRQGVCNEYIRWFVADVGCGRVVLGADALTLNPGYSAD